MKKNKKGFTLAELLIVVAIIAVLTAVAVPLFVGALNKAEDAVKEANIRAVRGEAVAKILLADIDDTDIYKSGSTTLEGPWYVNATVTKNGQVTITSLNTSKDTYSKDECKKTKTGYTVVLEIKADELKKN